MKLNSRVVRMIFLKCKLDPFIPLFDPLQWLLITFKIKIQTHCSLWGPARPGPVCLSFLFFFSSPSPSPSPTGLLSAPLIPRDHSYVTDFARVPEILSPKIFCSLASFRSQLRQYPFREIFSSNGISTCPPSIGHSLSWVGFSRKTDWVGDRIEDSLWGLLLGPALVGDSKENRT